MRYLFALGLIVLAGWQLQAQARGAEGAVRTLEEASQPAADRHSRYLGSPAPAARAASAKPAATRQLHASKARAGRVVRFESVRPASHSSGFYLYDAASRLITDRDHDGYFSEFRIRFDADTAFLEARVYAQLYLRRLGEREWWLYHTTDDFWIEGQSGSDDYFVTTALEDGFASADYDALIDLHEAGTGDLVASLGPAESGALSLLPLEEAGLDVPVEIAGYRIGEIITELLLDEDRDGHHSSFRIWFDPDAEIEPRFVYARLWVRARGGEWIEEYVSADFLVDTAGDGDAFAVSVDWLSGYPTSFYDVQIDLHDSASDLLVASAGSERPELAQIPLEDASRDLKPGVPAPGGGGSTSSNERGGGGALTLGWLLGALAGAAMRRRAARRRELVKTTY